MLGPREPASDREIRDSPPARGVRLPGPRVSDAARAAQPPEPIGHHQGSEHPHPSRVVLSLALGKSHRRIECRRALMQELGARSVGGPRLSGSRERGDEVFERDGATHREPSGQPRVGSGAVCGRAVPVRVSSHPNDHVEV